MIAMLHVCTVVSLGMAQAEANAFDAAPFGEVHRWSGNGVDYGLYWEDPRDIFRVVVAFDAPPPESLRLEYWQSSWPQHRIPRDAPSGSGASGWLDVGDWYQGEWKTADTKMEANGNTRVFTFNPINAREFTGLADFDAVYRTTLKLRVVAEEPLPAVKSLQAFTDSELVPLDFEVEWGGETANAPQARDDQASVFNGTLEEIEPLTEVAMGGFSARILYAEPKAHNSFDETIVTANTPSDSCSFAPRDLIRDGRIFIPDYGILIRLAGDTTTYDEAQAAHQRRAGESIYDRVFEAPEQSFSQAWNDMPPKGRHYIPLSFEGGRQHFGLDENGNAFCMKNWIEQIPGKDTPQCLWDGRDIHFTFDAPGVVTERTLVEGCLPIVESAWNSRAVKLRQTAFVTPLNGVPPAGSRIWADDTLVLLVRFTLAEETTPAQFNLGVEFGGQSEPLALDGDCIVAAGSNPQRLHMLVLGGLSCLRESEGQILFNHSLSPGTQQLVLAIPFVTMTSPETIDRLRGIRFEEANAAVYEYWKRRVDAGARILTPEPMINDFYKAHLPHLLINTEREVGVSDRYMAKVGTFHYGVYSNESCMMVSDLDRRGYHERAEQALETWLHYQGTVALPGSYADHDGVFYGAGGYEHGGYNQHHGWVLWCLGEHYLYTRDNAWIAHAAPGIVKGCEWIIRERNRNTKDIQGSPLRAIERGLLPPGSLEDIRDWRAWLSNNVYSWWGMDNAARALLAAGHPEGERLAAEAEAYRQDVRAAFLEAMRRSPVVRLRDGSHVPQIPSDVHRRGRSFGWITETLEGAIHLVRCGILDPDDRVSTWILKDFEDNRYISDQYGYPLEGAELDRYWFGRGGISQQANLLCSPLPYLLRDEPLHYLRAYFNAFAASYFPDTRMMTEHALPKLGDWRGDHYKTSDEANSTYWLRLMFIQERGDELWIGSVLPRYWLSDGQVASAQNAATYFGPMSVSYTSNAAQGRIEAVLDPPRRNPPAVIRVRFRHPEGLRMVRCEVGGLAYDRFDPEKEWVELDPQPGPVNITAFYR